MVMLDLAALAYARGESVSPAEALPLYVRDKVALNVREQAELRLEKDRQRVSRKGPMQ
jgi:hypothetical protein